jgi:hypothetical protein
MRGSSSKYRKIVYLIYHKANIRSPEILALSRPSMPENLSKYSLGRDLKKNADDIRRMVKDSGEWEEVDSTVKTYTLRNVNDQSFLGLIESWKENLQKRAKEKLDRFVSYWRQRILSKQR